MGLEMQKEKGERGWQEQREQREEERENGLTAEFQMINVLPLILSIRNKFHKFEAIILVVFSHCFMFTQPHRTIQPPPLT